MSIDTKKIKNGYTTWNDNNCEEIFHPTFEAMSKYLEANLKYKDH